MATYLLMTSQFKMYVSALGTFGGLCPHIWETMAPQLLPRTATDNIYIAVLLQPSLSLSAVYSRRQGVVLGRLCFMMFVIIAAVQTTVTSALARHNTRHTAMGKFRIWEIPWGGTAPCLTFLESSRRADVKL